MRSPIANYLDVSARTNHFIAMEPSVPSSVAQSRVEPPAIPYLAGQYARHITFTLDMWRKDYRKASANSMTVIAQKLSNEDIVAVAAYYQQAESPLDTTVIGQGVT